MRTQGDRSRARTPLRAETVARTALALVDSGGLESLTMRRLAASLEVQLPTLYRLFDNKQALLDETAETLLAGVLARADLTGDTWEERAAALARALRETLLAQRDGARIVGGTYTAQQATLTLADTMLAILGEAELPPEKALWAATTLFSYVLGEVLEQQGATGGETELLAASVRGGRYPRLAATPWERFVDFDARFDFGIRVLTAGLRAECARRP
ncbi:TetR/AcrR family transcriptional regulator C-terminal domain-containing protein [Streptomyces sp. AC536]|uniref:TetR/AcrR family transcriptional regulator C-terminal domain-containing protein n=1 Tax=Streptomyces buecherae TaxID=2763006 RepID=UPI00164DABEA|nr:TetR/AcrR family transcriptional regulator C-terminal domain-containing protein [Streptomyces buecherae]MBC3984073.1 TetR/AcrR family transcriptional regulator C-terminal domain-containing protein [Streptomyces buecherae]QNJ44086.1 TetR/AcrR family transcriptional regulator C-terminal domain-containing protein [Streptomyces buecherae]